MSLEKPGVPSVAVHTHVFARLANRPRAPTACRARARPTCRSRWSTSRPSELRGYIEGTDPVSKRPFMQEMIEGLTTAARRGGPQGPVVRALDAAPDRARYRGQPAAAVRREQLDRQLAGHPADRGARRGDAEGHEPCARQGGRPLRADGLPRILGDHGREGRGQRGDGGLQAGIFAGRSGALPRAA